MSSLPARKSRNWTRIAAYAALILGAAIMLVGLVLGMLAPDARGTWVGVAIEFAGVGPLILGLHGVIDG